MLNFWLNLRQTCAAGNLVYLYAMAKYIALLVLAATLLGVTGCESPSGAREYVPGKGWVPLNGK